MKIGENLRPALGQNFKTNYDHNPRTTHQSAHNFFQRTHPSFSHHDKENFQNLSNYHEDAIPDFRSTLEASLGPIKH